MRLQAGSTILATSAVALLSSAFGAHGATPAASPADAAPPGAFAQCRGCHTVTKGGASGVGPNLFGTLNAPAGSKPGYAYSPAMKGSRIRWDRATLDTYLANPKALVPGTKMAVPGVKNPAQREAIVAYLATLK
jgi:cytochrome c